MKPDTTKPDAKTLEEKIRQHRARIGIIGMGYVGLPLALRFAEEGFPVTGFDIDEVKVKSLAAGKTYILHIQAERIQRTTREGTLSATTDFARLAQQDAIIICVPTPLTQNREPDLSYIRDTSRAVAKTLRPGQLVVLESSTYPGTTEEVIVPLLEKGGLKAGVDFLVAFSPEREDPGNPSFNTKNIPKLVGGLLPEDTRVAALLYSQVLDQVVPTSSCKVAEAAKILENVYRCVNIAMVNEAKIIFDAMGIDVWEVIAAASTKPFGYHPFYPGPGLGGHCIPIDPYYLTWKARAYDLSTRFIELAGEVNTMMPHYVVTKTMEALNQRGKPLKNSPLLVLGVAYKKDIEDPRESPSFKIMELLLERGARVSYHDPFIPHLPKMRHYPHLPAMESVALTEEGLRGQDAVLVVTDHTKVDYPWIARHCQLFVDTRNVSARFTAHRDKVVKA